METFIKEGIGRFYVTPKGIYPSVTTILNAYGDKSKLEEWRNNIGEEKAQQIAEEAKKIGTHLHYLFECFLKNEQPKIAQTPEEKKAELMFKNTKNKLLKLVKEVIGIEEAIWSDKFRIAGRFDLLCKTKDNKIALIDLKNTKRIKMKKDIDSYRQQLAFYAIMIKETLKIDVEEQKIFMVNREGFSQIFDFKKEDTSINELIKIRKNFWIKYGY